MNLLKFVNLFKCTYGPWFEYDITIEMFPFINFLPAVITIWRAF